MADWKIAYLPGDGIGPEVGQAGLDILAKIARAEGHRLVIDELPVGWVAIERHGDPLPVETLNGCLEADAIFHGAVGHPDADDLPPDRRPESGLLRLRAELGCFANLRPVRVGFGLLRYSALAPATAKGADALVVRELNGGLYYGEPRGISASGDRAWNTMTYTVEEVRRVARVAFECARGRRGRLTSVDKANVLEVSQLWRKAVDGVGERYPDVLLEHLLVDRAAMELVVNPARFDTILTGNIFGDILSELIAAWAGSLGVLGSASLGGRTDLYEPVHGSAPDLAGTGAANPTGAIASVALMLRHTFRLPRQATRVEAAIDAVYEKGYRTADLRPPLSTTAPTGPPLATEQFTRLVADRLDA